MNDSHVRLVVIHDLQDEVVGSSTGSIAVMKKICSISAMREHIVAKCVTGDRNDGFSCHHEQNEF